MVDGGGRRVMHATVDKRSFTCTDRIAQALQFQLAQPKTLANWIVAGVVEPVHNNAAELVTTIMIKLSNLRGLKKGLDDRVLVGGCTVDDILQGITAAAAPKKIDPFSALFLLKPPAAQRAAWSAAVMGFKYEGWQPSDPALRVDFAQAQLVHIDEANDLPSTNGLIVFNDGELTTEVCDLHPEKKRRGVLPDVAKWHNCTFLPEPLGERQRGTFAAVAFGSKRPHRGPASATDGARSAVFFVLENVNSGKEQHKGAVHFKGGAEVVRGFLTCRAPQCSAVAHQSNLCWSHYNAGDKSR